MKNQVGKVRQEYIDSLAALRDRLQAEEDSANAHCPPSSAEFIREPVNRVMKARAKYSSHLTLRVLKNE